ncbi:23S rRNA (adenine(2503)-C(2))-methyltransferase RlmN [Aquisalinus flavus]|uniref:Dual-specificity RNA methyltransferase RlmN n=1 Tax=Aquisalinus flavus TaxID=1526572 RepID=A0A8J2Y7I7_9PROT|nr:23S rRNA (adenine(2503)-C(2))-methyltransferase RlmN [Aquisalinus flavus]MBD0425547.1 23S rRNA (adenine(2503)-C(2))-methyltransferase RlmN [Aquisalinus flavus]UNE48826.1 23S rRNA (adenine(2503)-C(2))-methyltransferase RlmN [Aquisalinus flavus]GGD15203.1 dual-specificity RNA methyltransferase RlmN [Aquisalinus flavus]
MADASAPVFTSKTDAKINLIGLTREQLRARLEEDFALEPKKARMRASQIWQWIYTHGVKDFAEMTNISKDLRAGLTGKYRLTRPEIVEHRVSSDGTRKYLLRFAPGVEAEAVFIPGVGKAGALCVSSQVGCTLNCTFCHTGTQRLVRNLTAAEITAQVLVAKDDIGEWPSSKDERQLTNIVFMGMGEPLYNLDNVSDAIGIIADGEGISISRRRITVSTSGIVPEFHKLGTGTEAMLAISLHATNDELRNELVPINKKYPLEQLLQACRDYPGVSNARRITFEYVMLKGVNDSDAEARELVRLLKGIPAKINLIPFNPWEGSGYECADWSRIEAFAEIVNRAGYASPIRTPRGRDIGAACGQLKTDSVKQRASEARRARLYGDGLSDTTTAAGE